MTINQSSNRYARQIQFHPVGEAGHLAITKSRVAILGCGALGTVAAEILTRAGVGTLQLIDRDIVEWTNLQRQSLFTEEDAIHGHSKAEAACNHLRKINSEIELNPIVSDITSENINAALDQADLVIDAADNFLLRFLLNDWSLKHIKPWVHGGCVGATGQIQLFTGSGGPCFRCLVPKPPPAAAVDTCDTAGVIGAATHTIASLQASEAIKWISGNREQVRDRLLSLDLWNNRIRELQLPKNLRASCVACGQQKLEYLEGGSAVRADTNTVLCGRDAVQIQTDSTTVDFQHLADRWQNIGRVQKTRFFVRLYPDDSHSLTMFRDGRVVVTGTDQVSEAKTLLHRFIGG